MLTFECPVLSLASVKTAVQMLIFILTALTPRTLILSTTADLIGDSNLSMEESGHFLLVSLCTV